MLAFGVKKLTAICQPKVSGCFLVPLIGGLGCIESPNWQLYIYMYTWYISGIILPIEDDFSGVHLFG